VFSEQNLPEMIADPTTVSEFLALPTNQRAREDLVGTGEKVELEKDRLLNVFMNFARALCDKIRSAGYWADFIDPCSGLPMLTINGHKVVSPHLR
jgi:Methylmalonic aciduria and homocystinuria type D protein